MSTQKTPALFLLSWHHPDEGSQGQGGRTGLPGSPSAGSVVCVGPCADLAGKLNTEEDVPQPSCCLWPVVKGHRELQSINDAFWTHLNMSGSAWAVSQNLTWLKPIFGAKHHTCGALFPESDEPVPQPAYVGTNRVFDSPSQYLRLCSQAFCFQEPVGGSRNTVFPFRCILSREKRQWGV